MSTLPSRKQFECRKATQFKKMNFEERWKENDRKVDELAADMKAKRISEKEALRRAKVNKLRRCMLKWQEVL